MTTAAVFFSGDGSHWTSRFMRPGFRHVEVAVHSEAGWTGVCGKLGHLIEAIPLPCDFDPRQFALVCGLDLVLTEIEPRPRWSPIGLQTCVGVVKAVLGIRAPLVITPWQLWKHLRR